MGILTYIRGLKKKKYSFNTYIPELGVYWKFNLELQEKDKQKFHRFCKTISRKEKIPLYTFRCKTCMNNLPISLLPEFDSFPANRMHTCRECAEKREYFPRFK